MILGQIAWSDCFVFLIFLAPQLLIHVGFFKTAMCGIQALPFLLLRMPCQLIRERYLSSKSQQSPFVQHASLFQDIVIRCVRYAFASIPASIGKVFFSKGVALPFIRFRMLRHGLYRSPIYWKEVNRDGLNGVYMIDDVTRRPDIVVYYCHGGGFSMGSAYFYLEFLMVWISLLKDAGYENPALFALEYTLVPEATYPTQVQQTLSGYKYVLSIVDDPSKICIPGLAVIISPWAAIISPKNQNTLSDYLNAESLHLYGSQYIGTKASADDSLVSPGRCKDLSWWRRASPSGGWYFVYGAEEVFAPETKDLILTLEKAGIHVAQHEEKGWIHAWPIVKLFLCNTQEERLSGLKSIIRTTTKRIPIGEEY